MAAWDAKAMAEPTSEAPYQGRAGATRVESVHLPLPGGALRTLTVHRAVNVATDPQLRERALAGALHRFDGVELAVPFVLHDPAARKLAIVVPEALRHEQLRERARFLAAVAEDASAAVPAYVADATVVVGIAALSEYLARPSAASQRAAEEEELVGKRKEIGAAQQDLIAREDALAERESTLLHREQRMRERAEDVTRREDELTMRGEEHARREAELARREAELARRAEELEGARRDLAMREQELDQRLESIVERERALIVQGPPPEPMPVTISAPTERPRTRSSHPPPPSLGLGLAASSMVPAMRAPVVEPIAEGDVSSVEDDVEELDELEPIRTHPGTEPSIGMVSTGEERISLSEVEELVDDDDVEEEVDDDDIQAAPQSDAPLADDTAELDAADEVTGVSTGVAAAPGLGDRSEMVALLADGLELHVALGDRSDALEGEADLLVQLVVVEGCPVVVLALVDPTGARPFVRRTAIDPRAAEGRRMLESLRRRFEARLVLFGEGNQFLRVGRVAGPRELNVARTLDRVSRLRADAALDAGTAIERALAAPPPIAGASPFAAEDEKGRLDTAAQTARALEELADWASPEKMDHALLVLSVPRDTIDATFVRVLERAVEHGLALPASLGDRALGAGLADDAGALVSKQIAAFRRTLALPDRGGLDDEAVAGNWERLLAAAADAEVALDPEAHDMAWRAIRDVRGEQTGSMPGGALDPARIAAMGTPELVMLLEHPRHRRVAAIALAERGDPELAEAICKAVRKMPRAEVVRVVPRMTKLGDEAGDALIDGLTSRKTFARQAFALALGHLKLRRAVVPLLHLLTSETTDVWREVARVYGSFGNASFRTLSQKLHDPKAPEERYVLTLAHLANHGCVKQVEALTKDADPRVAGIAVRSLQSRDRARWQEEAVGGKRPLEGDDGVLAFSRRFVEELEGTAPESDLATLPGEDI
ncbi:hypothetical protein [Sandaracinus amylolyticus]|uniref:Methyltransferase type 11 n=1 Tax=Sandaracinus amylolyticus TaxID=927083 RepID=A0A0F6W9C4_9BACT|nr:hypothetical protein [Sandaracinus amylolyticus]AKF10665.1 Methyltransferase type 11 [Sandaracinus amylolyticus]